MAINDILASIYGTEKIASDAAATTAEQEIDFNQMTAAQLLELLAAEEEQANAGTEVEKVASEQELQGAYLYGQMMAQGFHDQMSKVASENTELPNEIDLSQITADQFIELMESGEYELEKTAGMGTGALLGKIREGVIGAGRATKSAVTAENLRSGVKGFMKHRGKEGEVAGALRKAYAKRAAKGAAQTGAAAAAVGGAGYALKKKMDK